MTETVITFPDIGLQLGVMNALLRQRLLTERAISDYLKPVTAELSDEDDLNFDLTIERKRVGAALARLATFPLQLADVQRVRQLDFDGGNDIYMLIERLMHVDSGGEADYYLVGRLDGLEALTGLEDFVADGYAFNVDAEQLSERLNP